MTTPIQPVPEVVLAAEFPTLADRPAGNYNTKAKSWADSENAMATRTREIVLVGHNNATVATEQAVIAATKADEAAGSAQAAEVSAQNAAAVSGAAKWVSGSEYAEGEVAWSPIDYLAYRRKVPGAGTTDPSDDAVNWASIFPEPPEPLPFSNMTALAQSQAIALLF